MGDRKRGGGRRGHSWGEEVDTVEGGREEGNTVRRESREGRGLAGVGRAEHALRAKERVMQGNLWPYEIFHVIYPWGSISPSENLSIEYSMYKNGICIFI